MFCLKSIAQHPDLCTSLPKAPAEAEPRQNNSVKNTMRNATPKEQAEYKAMSGYGSTKKKADFRNMITAQKLEKAKATQKNTQASTQSDTKIGKYRNFWVIVEKEGGRMDRETGMRVAHAICSHCEKKGAPAVMWDAAAGIMKYLHCEVGVSDVQTKVRKSILSADVDMDEDCVRMAMQQGLAEGLSTKIPPEQLGKIPAPGSFGEPKLQPDRGEIGLAEPIITPTGQAPTPTTEPKLQPDAGKIGVDKTIITPTGQAPTPTTLGREQPDLAKQPAGLDLGVLAKQLALKGCNKISARKIGPCR